MSKNILLKNARLINEAKSFIANVLISGELIEKISTSDISVNDNCEIIDLSGKYLIPGAIDDQVHFREPGMTYKADIASESKAAAAGGITSFMDMPNNNPPILNQELLQSKYDIAEKYSAVNYSFYMGASNDNLDEVLKTNPKNVCGIKVFMGSSTGNMLVDNKETLENIFANSKLLIATHCEDEETIKANTQKYIQKYGDYIDFKYHPEIRSREACYKSSSLAIELAKKHKARLHILHLTTEDEMHLFSTNSIENKNITAEVCVHHLWFDDEDYDKFGSRIKWNPAVKKKSDKEALRKALIEGKIDVVATDHAPHTIQEKSNSYLKAPSGGPLVQHSVVAMFELSKKGIFSPELIVEKMCHAPAKLFKIEKRGFIKEGYYADLVVINPNEEWEVNKENILYKCNWSPFEGQKFSHKIEKTFVNGNLVYDNGKINDSIKGKRLKFNR
jgi:dihydroorotase